MPQGPFPVQGWRRPDANISRDFRVFRGSLLLKQKPESTNYTKPTKQAASRLSVNCLRRNIGIYCFTLN